MFAVNVTGPGVFGIRIFFLFFLQIFGGVLIHDIYREHTETSTLL